MATIFPDAGPKQLELNTGKETGTVDRTIKHTRSSQLAMAQGHRPQMAVWESAINSAKP